MTDPGLRVLVVGSGGREHALATAIERSPRCAALFTAPGSDAMPGVRLEARSDDVCAIVDACTVLDVNLVVVGPETPLAAGLADALIGKGVAVFGPTRDAARRGRAR